MNGIYLNVITEQDITWQKIDVFWGMNGITVRVCLYVLCGHLLGRANLLALVCGVYCEFVIFPLVSWVRCGT